MNKNQEIVKSMMKLDFHPADNIEVSQLAHYTKLPLGETALASGVLASLLPAFRTIATTTTSGGGDLYQTVLPKEATLGIDATHNKPLEFLVFDESMHVRQLSA
jgi:hypothetical protein